MRKYTNRQITNDSTELIKNYLEKQIENIVKKSEQLLLYNSNNKNQRINKDCINSIINNNKNVYNSHLSEKDSNIEVN